MNQALIDKIKKARQVSVSVKGFTFTVRRPTDMDILYLRRQSVREGDLLREFVVGWDLKEIDLIPGGAPVPVEFDQDLFVTWVEDQPECWGPLIDAVLDSYAQHKRALDESMGKPDAG
jgi:hypothetical protein